MAGRIFDPDNIVFHPLGKLADVLMLSLMWLATSLPLFTLGPATAALYDVSVKCLRQEETSPYSRYLSSFRLNFKVGALATLTVWAEGALLWFLRGRLLAFALAEPAGVAVYGAFCVAAVFLVGSMSYYFPVLSRFTFGVGGLISVSLRLAAAHLPTTMLLGVLSLGAILLCVNFVFPVLVVPAVGALLSSFLLERIFRPLMEGQGE